jgi:hypothetical protein
MRAIAIFWLVLGGFSASAQDLSAYAGGAVGAFDHDNPGGGAFSDTVASWKLYGGFQVGAHFGLELGHGSTSSIRGGASGSPLAVDVRYFSVAHRVDFKTSTFKAMGYLPFDWGALWLGYGFFQMDADVDVANAPFGRTSLSVDDRDEMGALGIEWRLRRPFDRGIDFRLEYEWLSFPLSDVSTLSLGVAYRFEDL